MILYEWSGTARVPRLAVLGWADLRPFFSHPHANRADVATFAMTGVAFFPGGNLQS